MFENRATVVVGIAVLLYFIWMDIALFYQVHTRSITRIRHVPGSTDTPATPAVTVPQMISPFTGLSVKLMMMDPVNNYIHVPAAHIFNEVTNFSTVFYFVTPNMVSFIGLLFAVGAAKCMSMESRIFHCTAIFLFQIRTWFDALDGMVARSRLGMVQHVSLRNTSGYVVDGVADALGFTAFLIGCFQYLRVAVIKTKYYLPLNTSETCKECKEGNVINCSSTQSSLLSGSQRRVFIVVLCFGLQMAASAYFWDHYINAYHNLLESATPNDLQAEAQNEVLRSSITWVLMWFWRLTGAHNLIQLLLLSIYVNKLWEFLCWIQYVGFAHIFMLAFFTELHLSTVRSYVLSFSWELNNKNSPSSTSFFQGLWMPTWHVFKKRPKWNL